MELPTIQRRISLIEQSLQEIRTAKDALKQELESDAGYVEAARLAKEAAAKKKVIKDQLMNQQHNRKLLDDIQTNVEEIVTLREILSSELMEFYQEKNTDEVPDETGDLRKFKIFVKLLPKRGTDERF